MSSTPHPGSAPPASAAGLPFCKMHGAGNDYVFIDAISRPAPANPAELAIALSRPHFGVGSDGLILIVPSEIADVGMQMFNADGSEAEMCGNGLRCLARRVLDTGLARTTAGRLTVETGRGVLDVYCAAGDTAGDIRINMGPPVLEPHRIPCRLPGSPPLGVSLDVDDRSVTADAVSMGNPHLVLWVDDVATAPVGSWGPRLERHAAFPRQTNVEFARVIARDRVQLRVWERGSGETLACGTGACAAVVLGRLRGLLDASVSVELPGGVLRVDWDPGESAVATVPVWLSGPVCTVFEGTWLQ